MKTEPKFQQGYFLTVAQLESLRDCLDDVPYRLAKPIVAFLDRVEANQPAKMPLTMPQAASEVVEDEEEKSEQ